MPENVARPDESAPEGYDPASDHLLLLAEIGKLTVRCNTLASRLQQALDAHVQLTAALTAAQDELENRATRRAPQRRRPATARSKQTTGGKPA